MTDDNQPEPTFADAVQDEDDLDPDVPRTLGEGPVDEDDAEADDTFASIAADEDYAAEVRSAEAAHQRSILDIPDGDFPAELERALELRVLVNLAQADGKTVTRAGGKDPQVRQLEHPYLRRRPASA